MILTLTIFYWTIGVIFCIRHNLKVSNEITLADILESILIAWAWIFIVGLKFLVNSKSIIIYKRNKPHDNTAKIDE